MKKRVEYQMQGDVGRKRERVWKLGSGHGLVVAYLHFARREVRRVPTGLVVGYPLYLCGTLSINAYVRVYSCS